MPSTILSRFHRIGLPVVLAGSLAASLAHADVYTWTDKTGRLNVSNIAPPDGVEVTSVIHEDPPTPAMLAARDAAHAAELEALNARVAQLQDEVERAREPAPAPVRVVTPPPVVQYVFNTAPPPAQYAAPQLAYDGCNPSWYGCAFGYPAFGYPASVVVLRTPAFPRFHRFGHERRAPMHRPMPAGHSRTFAGAR
jgi:hypothetical protein